jgi:hypothetical protein
MVANEPVSEVKRIASGMALAGAERPRSLLDNRYFERRSSQCSPPSVVVSTMRCWGWSPFQPRISHVAGR